MVQPHEAASGLRAEAAAQRFPQAARAKVSTTAAMSQTAARSPSVREETQQERVCALCKQPITKRQLPAIRMKNGDQLHVECWQKYDEARRKPN